MIDVLDPIAGTVDTFNVNAGEDLPEVDQLKDDDYLKSDQTETPKESEAEVCP